MKSWIFIIFILSAQAGFSQSKAGGTNIRGKIVKEDKAPLSAARVDLYSFSEEEWVLLESATTDRYGSYVIYGLAPGTYFLQVNGLKNYEIEVEEIDYRVVQFQDIPKLVY